MKKKSVDIFNQLAEEKILELLNEQKTIPLSASQCVDLERSSYYKDRTASISLEVAEIKYAIHELNSK